MRNTVSKSTGSSKCGRDASQMAGAAKHIEVSSYGALAAAQPATRGMRSNRADDGFRAQADGANVYALRLCNM